MKNFLGAKFPALEEPMNVDPFDMSVHQPPQPPPPEEAPIRKVSDDPKEQAHYEQAIKGSREARDRLGESTD